MGYILHVIEGTEIALVDYIEVAQKRIFYNDEITCRG